MVNEAESEAYLAALDWLHSLADTERTGAFVRDPERNVQREAALLAALGNPQSAYGITHIAGTKGKGSTAALLASILRAAGVRTGLYTSPHLHSFRERIQIDGAPINADEATRLIPQVRAAVERVQATQPDLGGFLTFDAQTALAFAAFQAANVRHAVIETGLGGRLDPTNVVAPLATAITSISYDHMAILGNTLTEIAGEKAGILKLGVPAILAPQLPEALAVLMRVAAERGVTVARVGPEGTPDCSYTYRLGTATPTGQTFDLTTPTNHYANLDLALLGAHQVENSAVAVALAETLRAAGLPIDDAAIRRGLREVVWPARMQVIGHKPEVVVDGAHNADSMARLLAGLRRHFSFERLLIVLGVMADKDLAGIARELAAGGVDHVFVTAAAVSRAASPEALAEALRTAWAASPTPTDSAPQLTIVPSVREALQAARTQATPRDLICVTGSFAVAAEALISPAGSPHDAEMGSGS